MATHTFQCYLRWGDMDAYGVVNNVVLLRLMEEARVDLISRFYERGDALPYCGFVVVRHTIEYKRTLIHRREPVDIETWISDLQAATIIFESTIRDRDIVFAMAATTMAPYVYEKQHPRRFTESETAFFRRYAAKYKFQ